MRSSGALVSGTLGRGVGEEAAKPILLCMGVEVIPTPWKPPPVGVLHGSCPGRAAWMWRDWEWKAVDSYIYWGSAQVMQTGLLGNFLCLLALTVQIISLLFDLWFFVFFFFFFDCSVSLGFFIGLFGYFSVCFSSLLSLLLPIDSPCMCCFFKANFFPVHLPSAPLGRSWTSPLSTHSLYFPPSFVVCVLGFILIIISVLRWPTGASCFALLKAGVE